VFGRVARSSPHSHDRATGVDRRRSSGRRRLAVLAAGVLLLTGGGVAGIGTPSAGAVSTAGLPEGWRWASFRNVEVGVPGGWKDTSRNLISGSCAAGPGAGNSVVGRPPFAVEAMACGRPAGAGDRRNLVRYAGRFVAFDFADPRIERPADTGDRRSVERDRVLVVVQASRSLREAILATVRTIDVDANGCPVRDAISAHPGLRPRPAVALSRLSGVQSVSACRYTLAPGSGGGGGVALFSSLRVSGDRAGRALAAVARAPRAGGQDEPEQCLHTYGWEIIVLRVVSDRGLSRVHVRYSGCDHNGVDDGVSVRRLTRAVRPFAEGPNEVTGFSGGHGKYEALAAP
jgi:hypothetical protein